MLAALIAPGGAAADARWSQGPLHWDRVTIIYVAPEPCCGSGVIAVYVKMVGDTAKHGRRTYLIPFMGRGQRAPRIGDRCRVSYHRYDVNGHISGDSADTIPDARVLSTLRCGKGRAWRAGAW
jgi:hypothetical protein